MIAAHLDNFHVHLMRSSLWTKWRVSNPKENAAIMGYWDGRNARPSGIKSEFGLAFLAAADAYKEATDKPPPAGTVNAGAGHGVIGDPPLTVPLAYPVGPII